MPHRLVGAKIDVRVTSALLECFASNQRVAGHALSGVRKGLRHDARARTRPRAAKGPRVAHTAPTWTEQRHQRPLQCGPDRQASLFTAAENPSVEHENVRRPAYHHWSPTRPNPTQPIVGRPPMLNEHNLHQPRSLRLDDMVRAVQEQAANTAADALAFDDRLTLLVRREVAWRNGGRVSRRVKAAKFKIASACIEDIKTGVSADPWTAAWWPRGPAVIGFAMRATC